MVLTSEWKKGMLEFGSKGKPKSFSETERKSTCTYGSLSLFPVLVANTETKAPSR